MMVLQKEPLIIKDLNLSIFLMHESPIFAIFPLFWRHFVFLYLSEKYFVDRKYQQNTFLWV